MRRIGSLLISAAFIAACNAPQENQTDSTIAPEDIQSGYTFLTAETQALQDDDFANPGFLWVDRGEALFQTSVSGEPACQSCHEDKLIGIAATYPAIDSEAGTLLNIEGRINQCRSKYQNLTALEYESEDLLALTAYLAYQSRGTPVSVKVEGQAEKHYANGEAYFETRRGQFNLSCQQCHTESWGKKLRGDTISQGHGNGFPAYRLEWQSLGSIQRRLRDCDTGVRAEPLPFGDQTYIDVELYLAARAKGLAAESPAVRR